MSDHDLVQELHTAVRNDFCTFFARCFTQLVSEEELQMGWHVELMASKLVAVYEGRIRRLAVNVPPRHLKSLICSVAYPAWCLGHNPSATIMCVSYAHELSEKHARDCRAIMMSEWYRKLFPETRLDSARPAAHNLLTTAGGCRYASSVDGVLTGRGAGTIIIDDPMKPDEAASETERERVNRWYDQTLLSRLNNKKTGAIVLIMQRLHEDDLTGHVLQQGGWEHVRIPAIAEEDEEHRCETPWGPKVFRRKRGEALQPERESLEDLAELKRDMGSYAFAGQYQQAPAPAGGGWVQEAWFPRYELHQRPETFDRVVQS
ncbi:MAG TPA: hypothetical protein VFR68_09125 [Candidatus Dormibacteraeota bacterium]|nr:hypothetical protein [Candidatus Dormibacteraeota bacterium]